jgi:hypothetical protein
MLKLGSEAANSSIARGAADPPESHPNRAEDDHAPPQKRLAVQMNRGGTCFCTPGREESRPSEKLERA